MTFDFDSDDDDVGAIPWFKYTVIFLLVAGTLAIAVGAGTASMMVP